MIMNSWRGSFDTNLRESLLTKISREFVTHPQSDHEQFKYFAQSLRSGKNLQSRCMNISKMFLTLSFERENSLTKITREFITHPQSDHEQFAQ